MNGIKANTEKVCERVEKACDRSLRSTDEVTLVAVSKKFETDRITEAFEAGIRDFGENYAQEFRDKFNEIDPDINRQINWHFIGNLQKNKAKYVVGKVKLIHTLDKEDLAQELNKRASRQDVLVNCLIEVNISGENSKSGICVSKVEVLVEKTAELKNIRVTGLMGMPPYMEDVEKTRPYFIKLRELRDKLQVNHPALEDLSMGMSSDFEVAVEEGATIIRVGSAIFGPRGL